MIGYEAYIKKIKDDQVPADFNALHQAIGRKLAARRTAGQRSALAGVVVVLLLGLVAYISYPLMSGGNGQLFSYVFDQQELSDGPVINYVFSDTGTF